MITLSADEEKRYIELQQMALDFARSGETSTLQSMIKSGLPIELKDSRGNTLLMLSAYNGNYETSKMLVEMGADVNSVNDHGHSIIAGVAFKGYLDICKLLVENGVIIDNRFSKSPIVFASMFGRSEIVSYLQSLDSDKNSFFQAIMLRLSIFIKTFRKK
ncbi:ankyrin repeat domain-containing protein [Arcobacter sp. FWKO B]|uniref:ankyrin repeat domain-containing protein n=1 Tax=Arcobacter sp. FWKO B TaxID=2593672 RepID=UPI0018A41C7E|nr:ankyrin repeat domain-containing protein [Arcobacter sp. FWKO B]QOG11922.1 ankyrin repeat domain-containing protein [Arcobacter sp. FWKO B]